MSRIGRHIIGKVRNHPDVKAYLREERSRTCNELMQLIDAMQSAGLDQSEAHATLDALIAFGPQLETGEYRGHSEPGGDRSYTLAAFPLQPKRPRR